MELYPNFFDCIIADPPFGIDYNKGSHHCGLAGAELYEDIFTEEQYYQFSKDWLKKAYISLKKEGTLYLIIGWTRLREVLDAIAETKFNLINDIIWYFHFGIFAKTHYVNSHYHILFLTKRKKNFYFEPQFASEIKGERYEEDVWHWDENRANDKDHIEGHPCQLPLYLIKKILRISSKENDWIGDLFSGSGSTQYACRLLNRNVLSFEKRPKFIDLITKKAQWDKKNLITKANNLIDIVKKMEKQTPILESNPNIEKEEELS